MQQVVTVAPGTGIGFKSVQHDIQVKEQTSIENRDVLLYTLNLDRGKSEYLNEIDQRKGGSKNNINQVNVECSVIDVTDDNNIPIIGNYYFSFH